ncbi:hypothetical protein GCD22_02032 [Acidithiobacillus thiooxidans ATCC 19377]|uniref:Uncharacterized protein n=1 Tax=Acidithiobacillus thiooxidans ATCC 19377 TaxID=637390 RepID=A0A5P9XQZ3_ACITH|nr:hypothetical protein GCD22_02032 [Acidithiobacillus thiooxidans ATCC 19377]
MEMAVVEMVAVEMATEWINTGLMRAQTHLLSLNSWKMNMRSSAQRTLRKFVPTSLRHRVAY